MFTTTVFCLPFVYSFPGDSIVSVTFCPSEAATLHEYLSSSRFRSQSKFRSLYTKRISRSEWTLLLVVVSFFWTAKPSAMKKAIMKTIKPQSSTHSRHEHLGLSLIYPSSQAGSPICTHLLEPGPTYYRQDYTPEVAHPPGRFFSQLAFIRLI